MNKYEKKLLDKFAESDIVNGNMINLQNNIDIFAGIKKVIAVTSADNNFLSGICIKHLADTYANNKQKTLVVEANFHNPILKELYGDVEESSNIFKVNEYLEIVFATEEVYSAKKLMSEEFVKKIEESKEKYDRVLILVSPVESTKEILVFKDIIETSILVTQKDETLLKNIHNSISFIKKYDIPFAGVVFIK